LWSVLVIGHWLRRITRPHIRKGPRISRSRRRVASSGACIEQVGMVWPRRNRTRHWLIRRTRQAAAPRITKRLRSRRRIRGRNATLPPHIIARQGRGIRRVLAVVAWLVDSPTLWASLIHFHFAIVGSIATLLPHSALPLRHLDPFVIGRSRGRVQRIRGRRRALLHARGIASANFPILTIKSAVQRLWQRLSQRLSQRL
jgi:hypothetical protein